MRSASALVGYGPRTTRYTVVLVPGVWPATTRAFWPPTVIAAARVRADASDRYAANDTVQPFERAASAGAVSTGIRGGVGRGIGARGGPGYAVLSGRGAGVTTGSVESATAESEVSNVTG